MNGYLWTQDQDRDMQLGREHGYPITYIQGYIQLNIQIYPIKISLDIPHNIFSYPKRCPMFFSKPCGRGFDPHIGRMYFSGDDGDALGEEACVADVADNPVSGDGGDAFGDDACAAEAADDSISGDDSALGDDARSGEAADDPVSCDDGDALGDDA